MCRGIVIWLTGLSGSGKTTIAKLISDEFKSVKILDGDEVREHLSSDLTFSKNDRDENIKRISYVAKCIADCNGVAIVAAISPYKGARSTARELIGYDRFIEVFVDCDLNTLIERDTKGLYKRAMNGEIENFTGVNDPYDIPENPHITVRTNIQTTAESTTAIIEYVRALNHVGIRV